MTTTNESREAMEPATWRDHAYANLGAVRDHMTPEHVEAVQNWLAGIYPAESTDQLATVEARVRELEAERDAIYGKWRTTCEQTDARIDELEAYNATRTDELLAATRTIASLESAPRVLSALHPATADLVTRFAKAMAEKLHAAEHKYGYSDGWISPDWMDECRAKLIEHLAKGDPRDVANYCAFLWHHGERTAAAKSGGEWQPIETAPKDGFHIMLYKPEIVYVGFWADAGWCANARGCPVIESPTHWMPLPAAPKKDN